MPATRHLQLDLEYAEGSIRGVLCEGGHDDLPFRGWLELLALLEPGTPPPVDRAGRRKDDPSARPTI